MRPGLVRRRARGFWSCGRRASGQSPAFAPPFCAAGRAVRLHGGTVDHHQRRRRIRTADQRGENLLPQTALAPAIVAIEDRRREAPANGNARESDEQRR